MAQNRLKISRLFAILSMILLPAVVLGGGAYSARAETRAGIPSAPAKTESRGYTTLVMRVYFRNNQERDRLATEFGAEEVSTRDGYLMFIGDKAQVNTLRGRGLRVEIDDTLTYQMNNYDTYYNGYRTVEEMQAFLNQKVADFPGLVEKIDIGDSWCKTHPGQCTQPNSWVGFDLFVLHITNRSIPGPKPVFWYDAGIHSREIATPELAMRFIDYLLNGYNTNADARWIVDYQDVWVMPMLNPDGHHMNESNGNGTPTLHRKNADRDDGCTTYDQFGTDINRNFPFMWGCCGGSSSNPCSDTYRGPAMNSEEETQSLATKVRELIPDQRGPLESDPAPITTTGTLINMHSNAQQNLYPWGYTGNFAPNRTDLRNIGRHMSSPNVVPVGNGYEYCQNTECLYIVDGDEKNWAYGELGIPAYSLELSGSGFFPPYACIDNGAPLCTDGTVGPNGIWLENKGALTYHAKIARTPFLLTRGPDANNSPTVPVTVTQGSPAVVTATINYNWRGSNNEVNNYLQNVAAAEYYIDTPPWAGGTAQVMNATDGTFDSSTEAVDAAVGTGTLSLGRHIIFMRGRGVTDYEGYQSWGPMSAVFVDVIAGGGSTPTATVPPVATATVTRTSTVAVDPTPSPPNPTATSTTVPPTATTIVTATPTACTINFADVLPSNTFYPFIRCLACQGIINGYPCGGAGEPCNGNSDPYFRPGNSLTRGQLAKIVSQSAGLNGAVSGQSFEDVLPGTAFYTYTERLFAIGAIGGYTCGIDPNEPCIPPGNKPYFRPGASVTRGQLTKIVSIAAGFVNPDPATYTFTDVPVGSTFHIYVERLLTNRPGVMSGYPCGGTGEPCDAQNRNYFRPGATLTRGQASKIVGNTFFPNCDPPARK